MSKAEYKSSIRSKNMIRTAFFELAKDKDINKITITDIIKAANINRGTFYAHYADINDFQLKINNDIINSIRQILSTVDLNEINTPLPVLIKFSEFLQNDIDFFKIIFSSTVSDKFIEELQKLFVNEMKNNKCIDKKIRSSDEFDYRADFYAGGIAQIYKNWFKGNYDCSLNDIAYIINEIIKKNSLIF
ncbi:MAG: TetR/AcrR family transcriptional regulator [Eubacterium sp.]